MSIQVKKVEFHTPLQSFETRFDNLHEHKYPELHGGAKYGANLRQIDLSTNKSQVVGSFELNTNINL